MLKDGRAGATLPASDLQRAKGFFKGLGFEEEEDPGGVIYRCAEGTGFMVFQSSGAPSGTHTQVGFEVKDLEAEMADLRSRGVTFEEYDFPGMKTENGVLTMPEGKGAWFKDTEGNLLSLFSPSS